MTVALHLLSAGPGSPGFEQCIALARPGDSVLCFGDGVYQLLGDSAQRLQDLSVELFVLEEDALARGVGARLPEQVRRTDYDGWVTLTERHERSLSWF